MAHVKTHETCETPPQFGSLLATILAVAQELQNKNNSIRVPSKMNMVLPGSTLPALRATMVARSVISIMTDARRGLDPMLTESVTGEVQVFRLEPTLGTALQNPSSIRDDFATLPCEAVLLSFVQCLFKSLLLMPFLKGFFLFRVPILFKKGNYKYEAGLPSSCLSI